MKTATIAPTTTGGIGSKSSSSPRSTVTGVEDVMSYPSNITVAFPMKSPEPFHSKVYVLLLRAPRSLMSSLKIDSLFISTMRDSPLAV